MILVALPLPPLVLLCQRLAQFVAHAARDGRRARAGVAEPGHLRGRVHHVQHNLALGRYAILTRRLQQRALLAHELSRRGGSARHPHGGKRRNENSVTEPGMRRVLGFKAFLSLVYHRC